MIDLFICSNCGANLLKVGITEVSVGGVAQTNIRFIKSRMLPVGFRETGSVKEAVKDETAVDDIDEQYVICGKCDEELHDRTATDIIEAYENDLPHIVEEDDEAE